MKFKSVILGSLAIFASYLVFSLTLVSATDIKIMHGGVVQETAKYEQDKVVNLMVTPKHDPADITWTKMKLLVTVNGASLANSIKKIYLYKCRGQNPSDCVRSTPEIFENYADIELLWNDISERTGTGQYPRAGNLLFLVKLESLDSKESWAGFYTQTRQTAYNVFDTQSLNIQSVEVHAKSLELVQPIKTYIENRLMIPFKWATKVVFSGSSQLYAMGGSSQEMDSHTISPAVTSVNEISSINKDFYIISAKTSSGIANAITLNINPTFMCGNSQCEADLGETGSSCCYDCGCPSGQYCDVSKGINLSTCKSDSTSLSVISAAAPLISDCSRGFSANISARISNPPADLPAQIQGSVTLGTSVYTVMCSGASGSYDCSIPLSSNIKCGDGSYTIGPGSLSLSISYKDGPNTVSKAMSASFSGVNVNYECVCQAGYYCDNSKKTCQPEAPITLGIKDVDRFLDDYQDGDVIHLTAKIANPPAGTVLVSKSAELNLTGGQVNPGAPACGAPNSDYEYACTIPFQIANYDKTKGYTFSPNNLFFKISFDDGPIKKTKDLSAPFGPISIPSQFCGNNKQDPGETSANCCLDVACGTGEYCDTSTNGCRDLDSIGLSVTSAYPTEFTDCREAHAFYITTKISNAPDKMTLDYYAYMQAGLVKGWNTKCEKFTVDMYNCTVVIPPLEAEGCSLPYKAVGPNSINMSISFPNGKSGQASRHMNAGFDSIRIIPTYHCGDNICESNLMENASVCCYDCPCASSPSFGSNYYCDYDPVGKTGSCLSKDHIELIIDTPTAPVILTSCEITNTVNIKARIEGQPKDMRPQSYYATLNGTATQFISCSPEQAFPGANYTFNCTLYIPRLSNCKQDNTYVYDNNNFSMLISFNSAAGANRVETKALTKELPRIQVYQNIRTLYDIMQDARTRAVSRIKELKNVIKDLMDQITSCYETVKTIMYITFVSALIVGVWSGYSNIPNNAGSGAGQVNFFIGGARNSVSAGVQDASLTLAAGSSFAQAWAKFCEFLNTRYQMAIKSLEIEQKLDSMETCFEVQQHEMDIGRCNGQEQTCFNNMVSCINFNAISNIANEYTSIMQSGSNALGGMNAAFNNAANNAAGIGGGAFGYGTLGTMQVACNGNTGGADCCGCKVVGGGSVYYNRLSWEPSTLTVTTVNTNSCPGGILYIVDNFLDDDGITKLQRVSQSQITYRGDQQFDNKCHVFMLVCDKQGARSQIGPSSAMKLRNMTVKQTGTGTTASSTCECLTSSSQISCTGVSGSSTSGTSTRVTGCCMSYTDPDEARNGINKKRCTEALTQSECSSFSGTYKGDGKKCSDYTTEYSTICNGEITSSPPASGGATETVMNPVLSINPPSTSISPNTVVTLTCIDSSNTATEFKINYGDNTDSGFSTEVSGKREIAHTYTCDSTNEYVPSCTSKNSQGTEKTSQLIRINCVYI